jgi:thiamine biosynthesis protein ThiS
MKLVINGQPRELAPVATLAALLETLGLDPKAVGVERNREIVRRAELARAPLEDGDQIEIVHFVGGG